MINLDNIEDLEKNPPAVGSEINFIEKEMGAIFPKVYRELLLLTNGFITGEGEKIYGVDEIEERNQTWQVKEYAKGYIAVGDNSGGMVYLMKQGINEKEMITVDCGYMNPKDATIVTDDFEKWISEGCIIEEDSSTPSYIEPYDVILDSPLKGGSKDLLQIKKIYKFDMSMGDLLRGSKQLPFTIIRNITYAKALNGIEKLGELSNSLKLVPSHENKLK